MDKTPKELILDIVQNDFFEEIGDPYEFMKEVHVQELLSLKDDKAQSVIELLDEVKVWNLRLCFCDIISPLF